MVREVRGPIKAIIGAWDFNSPNPYRREIPVSHIAIMSRTIFPLVKRRGRRIARRDIFGGGSPVGVPKVRDPVEGVAPGTDIPRLIAGGLVVIEETFFTHKSAHNPRPHSSLEMASGKGHQFSSVSVDPLEEIEFFLIEGEVVGCERG